MPRPDVRGKKQTCAVQLATSALGQKGTSRHLSINWYVEKTLKSPWPQSGSSGECPSRSRRKVPFGTAFLCALASLRTVRGSACRLRYALITSIVQSLLSTTVTITNG